LPIACVAPSAAPDISPTQLNGNPAEDNMIAPKAPPITAPANVLTTTNIPLGDEFGLRMEFLRETVRGALNAPTAPAFSLWDGGTTIDIAARSLCCKYVRPMASTCHNPLRSEECSMHCAMLERLSALLDPRA
jgi:hypothetical protein